MEIIAKILSFAYFLIAPISAYLIVKKQKRTGVDFYIMFSVTSVAIGGGLTLLYYLFSKLI